MSRWFVPQTTQQRLLIDALEQLTQPSGQRLADQLRRHHRHLLRGCRDPDRRFRDFQNHFVHVTDGFWGGAPRLAHRWYDRFVDLAKRRRYADASHAAGVLSHYVTDPMHPLHTAQCPRGRLMHLPAEYLAWRNYDQFTSQLRRGKPRIIIELSKTTSWLGELILHAAARNHRHYMTLTRDIDLTRIVDDPTDCFGSEFESSHREMIGIAIASLTQVFRRAAEEIECDHPKIAKPVAGLTQATAMASAPFRWLNRHAAKKRLEGRLRKLVETHLAGGDPAQFFPTEVDVIERVVEVHHHEVRRRRRRQSDPPMIAGRIGLFVVEDDVATESEQANSTRRAA